MDSNAWILVWTAAAAVAACVTVVVTCIYSYHTVQLMRDQTAPKVVVYVNHSTERPTLLYIVIENVGNDVAENVRFTAARPIPAEAFGLPGMAVKSPQVMTHGPLITGIPVLGPKGTRHIIWGQYGGLEKALESGPIEVTFTYQQGKREFSGSADLEITSFANTDATEAPIVKIAKNAEKIEKRLAEISRAADGLLRNMTTQQESRNAEEADKT